MASGRLSVVIPAHNAAPFLGEAVESALSQTVAPFEVIIVDDGSHDETLAVARSFGRRVVHLVQDHRGAAAARNRGTAAATGDLIAYLDADDIWVPHALALLYSALQSTPGSGGAYGQVQNFVSGVDTEDAGDPSGPTAIPRFGTMLLARPVLDRVGPFDDALMLGEGIDWVDRARHLDVRLERVDELVLRRRVHSANTTSLRHGDYSDYLKVARAGVRRARAAALQADAEAIPG